MSSDGAFLEAALAIGARLVDSAVWHDGQCAWVGAEADPEVAWGVRYSALGADLYGGTAGVGWFLAQLAGATGEARFHRAATGALRHAVGRASFGDGFHAGPVGVACAAVRAAGLLDDEAIADGGRALLARCTSPSGARRCPDVILGAAGDVLGRVWLAGALDEPALLESALSTGEALLACARVDEHGWSWALPGRRFPRHLCGVSHGASGIGWALLELSAATGDDRFATAARGAFDYERSWLDPVAGTWPDHRLAGYRRGRAHRVPSPALGTWCHGEAGIAITRLRARALMGPNTDIGDADHALATVRGRVAAALPYDFDDLSLCHGLAGAADVLLAVEPEPALALGRVAIERHVSAGDWPCAAPGGVVPGLFRGLAGIGWFLLRLHDRRIPSPLLAPTGLDSVTRSA